jgi:hypothetical protein
MQSGPPDPDRTVGDRERRGSGTPATGSPPASGGALATPASQLDLRLEGTVFDEICTGAELETRGVDPRHSGGRAGDGGGGPRSGADCAQWRTTASARGRC